MAHLCHICQHEDHLECDEALIALVIRYRGYVPDEEYERLGFTRLQCVAHLMHVTAELHGLNF